MFGGTDGQAHNHTNYALCMFRPSHHARDTLTSRDSPIPCTQPTHQPTTVHTRTFCAQLARQGCVEQGSKSIQVQPLVGQQAPRCCCPRWPWCTRPALGCPPCVAVCCCYIALTLDRHLAGQQGRAPLQHTHNGGGACGQCAASVSVGESRKNKHAVCALSATLLHTYTTAATAAASILLPPPHTAQHQHPHQHPHPHQHHPLPPSCPHPPSHTHSPARPCCRSRRCLRCCPPAAR